MDILIFYFIFVMPNHESCLFTNSLLPPLLHYRMLLLGFHLFVHQHTETVFFIAISNIVQPLLVSVRRYAFIDLPIISR
jgi:hypothetical protein